jgi:thiol-disulfide isomerase/thioredoxin
MNYQPSTINHQPNNMKPKLLLLLSCLPFFSMCRPVTIKGNVINASGLPIAGATVTVVQRNKATITNKQGEFVFNNTSALDSIRISCIGYQTATIPNNERGLHTVLLKRSFDKAANHRLKPLAIGDTMPPFLFSNILNSSSTQINVEELKHKLVILDFWGTWCSSCLKGFAKLDSLQQLFPLQLQPILVNNTLTTADTQEKIHTYLSKRNQSPKTTIRFPIAIEDGPELQQLFPHLFLPHYVWLYNNRVVAITSSSELTKQNIQSILSGKPNFIKQKNDYNASD